MIKECFDLTGERFGKWLVISQIEAPDHLTSSLNQAYWICDCDCGHRSIVRANSLRSGKSKSCGCGTLGDAISKTSGL